MSAIQKLLTDHIDIWTAAETEKKSGRGRSSGNSGSVYGIKKLRELILELAVRGKLVPQDANDEPATELLKRIQDEKAKLNAEGKIKKERQLSRITKEEMTVDIPDGWISVHLSDLVNILNGRAYKKEELLDAGTPVLRVGNLFTSEHWYYSDLVLDDDKYCSKGDLLFAWSASFGPFIWEGDKSIYHYHIWKLDLYGGDFLYKRYLYTFLLEQTQKIKSAGHGVMMIHMTKEKMEKLVVFLPPLAEQHRIVAKVDELMALCDQLETQHSHAAEAHEKLVNHLLGTLTYSPNPDSPLCKRGGGGDSDWQRIAAHFETLFTTEASIDALKQTLLQLAVMGKLVPQNPNDEPASQLLKRIQAEKAKLVAEGKIKKDKPIQSIKELENPFELPHGWEWVRLQDLLDPSREISYGVIKLGNEPKSGGIHTLRCSDVKPGFIDLSGIRRVSEEIENDYVRTRLTGGEIVLNIRGTLGGVALVEPNLKGYNVAREVAVIPISMRLSAACLVNIMRSNYFWNAITEELRGIAYKGLNLGSLRLFSIPLPPISEQHRIVAKVDELMALCDQLKSFITEAGQLQQRLAEAVVEQAVAQ